MGDRNRLPARGRGRFVAFLAVVTVLAFAGSIALVATQHPGRMLHLSSAAWVVIGFAALCELRPVVMPARWEAEPLPMSSCYLFALLLGVGIGPVLILVGLLVVVADRGLARAWWRTAFNIAQSQLSWMAVYAALEAAARVGGGGPYVDVDGGQLLALTLAALAYILVNNALVDLAIVQVEGLSLGRLVARDAGFQIFTSLAVFACGPIIYGLMRGSVWMLLLSVLPVIGIFAAVQISHHSDHRSKHDPLTGLPNRALLLDRLDDELASGRPGALLLLDLDRFKEVNDSLGHGVGDELLCNLAQRLLGAVRPGDTVARLGGDEFAVLLPGTPDPRDAGALARRISARVRDPFHHGDLHLDVAASIGVALYPEHAADVPTLLRHADLAMYQAKTLRTGLGLYDPRDEDRSSARLALLHDLRRAAENGNLSVYYQPKIRTLDGRCVGVEALLRWQHPDLGTVSPADFIALAEQSPVMRSVTHFVLDTTIAQLAAWRDQGMHIHGAVNVSMRDLSDPAFCDSVADRLTAYEVSGHALVLEVTERVLADEDAPVADVLFELTSLGVRISLDDFGTGFSSLARLESLPVSELKIDRAFVARLGTEPDAPIVRSVVEMGHALGLRVVAEGVETVDASDRIVGYGCDLLQGYALAPPMDAAEATEWLRSRYAHEPVPALRTIPGQFPGSVSASAS